MIKKKYPYSKVDKGGKVRRKRIGMLAETRSLEHIYNNDDLAVYSSKEKYILVVLLLLFLSSTIRTEKQLAFYVLQF